jgi:hypothetical protein
MSIWRADQENGWLATHPLFTLALIEMVKQHGLYSLHAAGLCLDGRGLLLAGASGAGKSTLTLALLRAGFEFMGDDTLFLHPAGDGLQVLAFPDELDLTDETISFFPELRHLLALLRGHRRDKRQARAETLFERLTFAWMCRPAALLFPRIGDAPKSVLSPMTPFEALLELAPNILLTEATAVQAQLDALAALAQSCPCYRLETGRDFEALSRRLRELVGTP